MDTTNSQKFIQIPIDKINSEDLIKQLSDEVFLLRQVIDQMTHTVELQKETIQQLKDEIARLKGQKPKPQIRPSKLEGQKRKPDWHTKIGLHKNQRKIILFSMWVKGAESSELVSLNKCFSAFVKIDPILQVRLLEISKIARLLIKKIRGIGKPGQPKGKPRKKKTMLQIHEKTVIQPMNIPEEAIFKGYSRYTVQDIVFKPHNTKYYLARWELPDGSYIKGELPKSIHGHYGPELVSYILNQYYSNRVTENLLLDELHARGTLISAGQLNKILIENKAPFIEEAAELLPTAVKVEEQVQADDTGGRHNGKNQYTTIIGNRWFSIFATSESKNRINFLKLLQGGKEEYLINEDTVEYLKQVNVPDYLPGYIAMSTEQKFTTLVDLEQFLTERNITKENERRFLTEAALYANVIQTGIPRGLGVHSDNAGQFDVFLHSLCWIHEERHYRKLIMTTDESRADLERVTNQIWVIYQALKSYKEHPNEALKEHIQKQFDDIFQQKTSSPTLNHQLEKTYEKKQELLMVLERPTTPLHNNSSESDARSAKIKLKISGGTRSDQGRKVRDTFLSLRQTCRKLGINFIAFLQDRVRGLYEIPRLAIVICQQALAATSRPPNIIPSILDKNLMNMRDDRYIQIVV